MTTKYTEDHEWVRERDGVYLVGISDYAQAQLGEIVYVDLPAVGAKVTRGDDVAVVESVKAASEIKSPLSGSVTAINDQLNDSPELVNEDPEAQAWFYKMSADDASELESMMDAEGYEKFVAALD